MNKKLPPIRHDRRYVIAALVSALTFAVYLPALRNEFVNWDDVMYVYGNIRSLNWTFITWAFSDTSTAGLWHPLVWVSHALDYVLWGSNPFGSHLTNVLLHTVNTFFAVVLVLKLLEDRQSGCAQGYGNTYFALIAAGVTGLLFGLHPIHVESVAWVAERKDLLCSLFFMLSILMYLSYRSYKTYRFYLLSLAFFVFALASKPMAVTLPIVLLVLDWYPLKRRLSIKELAASAVEKAPFMFLSLIVSIVTVAAQKTAGGMEFTQSVPLSGRILAAFRSLMMYLWKIVMPVQLVPLYPYPEKISLLLPGYLFAVILVCGITAAVIIIAGKRPLWLGIWGYFIITLLPVLGIIQVGGQVMADRFIYLPSLGPFLLVGLMSAWIWKNADSFKNYGQYIRLIILGAGVALVIFLSYSTVTQIKIWKNSFSLWDYVIEKEPINNPMAYNSRGLAFFDKGEFDLAIKDYNSAIEQRPSAAEYYVNRGTAFCEKGDFIRSLADLDKAISLKPGEYMAYNNRGNVLYRKGDLEPALADFNAAIKLKPSESMAYNNRGNVFHQKGEIDRAIEDFNKAIILNPGYADAYYNRGVMFREKAQKVKEQGDKIIQDLKAFMKSLQPNAGGSLTSGDKLLKSDAAERATKDFQKACELGSKEGCDALLSLKNK
jgi:tetratricopeptide (TPR) repeat protein